MTQRVVPMTQRYSQLQKMVNSPHGFSALGACLLKVFQPHEPLGFICFSRVEREISLYPPVSKDREEEMLCFVLESDWKTAPNDMFVEAFRRLGVETGAEGEWICGGVLAGSRSDGPAGAWAVVQNPDVSSQGEEPDFHAIDLFLEELVRTWQTIQKFRETFEDVDYFTALAKQLGAMLSRTAYREQALILLLEISLHLAEADVGAILVVDDEGFRPEVDFGLPFEVLNDIRLHPGDESVLDRVMVTKQPVIVDDSSGPVIQVPRPHTVRVAGLAAIPLLVDREVVGLLCLAGGEAGKIVSAKRMEALGVITGVVTVAVENNLLRAAAKDVSEATEEVEPPSEGVSALGVGDDQLTAFESIQAAAEFRSHLACVQLGIDGLLHSGEGVETTGLETTMRRSLGALRRLCEDLELGTGVSSASPAAVRARGFSLTDTIEQALQLARDDLIEVTVEPDQSERDGDDRVCGDPVECRAAIVRLIADISRRCLKGSSVFVSVERDQDSVRARFEFDDDPAGHAAPDRKSRVGLHTARKMLARHGGALRFGRSQRGYSWSEVVLPRPSGQTSARLPRSESPPGEVEP